MRRPANRALLLCVLLDDGQNVRHVVFCLDNPPVTREIAVLRLRWQPASAEFRLDCVFRTEKNAFHAGGFLKPKYLASGEFWCVHHLQVGGGYAIIQTKRLSYAGGITLY